MSRAAAVLFVTILLTSAYFHQGGSANPAARIAVARSVVESGRLWVEESELISIDVIRFDGRWYSNKAPGAALLAVPAYALSAAAVGAFRLPAWVRDHLVCYLTTVLTVGLASAILGVLVYLVSRAAAGPLPGLLGTVAFAFGTMALPYSTNLFGHQLAAACAFGSFYLLWRSTEGPVAWRDLLAGLLGGYAVVIEYPLAIITALVFAYGVWKVPRFARASLLLAGAALSLSALLAYNQLAFGDPLFMTYSEVNREGFLGLSLPDPDVLWKVTFGTERGLFLFNPVMLLALPGFFLLYYRTPGWRDEAVLCAGVFFVFLVFMSTILFWDWDWSAGPRHFLPALPFAVPALAVFARERKLELSVFAAVSFVWMLMATAVNHVYPLQSSPFRGYLIPNFLAGCISQWPYGFYGDRPLVGGFAAFNLGKVFGLEGIQSLVPLFGLWLGCLAWILFGTRDLAEELPRSKAVCLAVVGALLLLVTVSGHAYRAALALAGSEVPVCDVVFWRKPGSDRVILLPGSSLDRWRSGTEE